MSQISPVKEKELSFLQTKVAACLLGGLSIEESARQCGCSSSTIDRWLKNQPQFQQVLNDGRRASLEVAANKLSRSTIRSAEILLQIAENPDSCDSSRIRSCELILSNAIKLNEIQTLEHRILQLEVSLSG
jgi:transposase-like protein